MADVEGNVLRLDGDTSTTFNSAAENVQWGGSRGDRATFSIGSDRGQLLNNMTLNAGEVYDKGWKDAAGQWKVSTGDTSFTVDTASPTAVGEPTSKTFTVTKGEPSATGGYAAVSHNGVAVARIDISDWWNEGHAAGRDSVEVDNIKRSTDDIYVGGDNYTTNVYAIATTDTGKELLHVFSVPGTNAYNEGHDDGVGSVTVSKPARQVADQYNSSDHSTNVYVVARASNGKTAFETFNVDGTNAYNHGKSSGANSLAISPSTAQTLDYGKTVTVTATTENGSGQTVSKSVEITAPADRYGTGYNAGYAGGKDTYNPTSITRTGYSTADKTVTVKAANSHQDLLTGQVISASEIYDAGYAAGYQAAKNATTVTGGITSIINQAQNYYQANGWASARVDGEQVDYTTFSKAQSFG